MDTETQQTLLLNSLAFAHKILTQEEYFKIDFGKVVYRVSGETDMLTYQNGKMMIQGFKYSTGEERVMLLVRGSVYDSKDYTTRRVR